MHPELGVNFIVLPSVEGSEEPDVQLLCAEVLDLTKDRQNHLELAKPLLSIHCMLGNMLGHCTC